ncbi:hypothetical protein ACFQ1S_10600 [Kibdelosporangium lantanae]|uniref:Uncharacterized protein n=1 Tax=Kibdelosporangium lantanae TaxID=1497396 RepID=A0ABW3M8M9_9PSEU
MYREVDDRIELIGINGTSWQHGCPGSHDVVYYSVKATGAR